VTRSPFHRRTSVRQKGHWRKIAVPGAKPSRKGIPNCFLRRMVSRISPEEEGAVLNISRTPTGLYSTRCCRAFATELVRTSALYFRTLPYHQFIWPPLRHLCPQTIAFASSTSFRKKTRSQNFVALRSFRFASLVMYQLIFSGIPGKWLGWMGA